ncbi:MAG: SRPBCC domain-containing protein [Pseudomonadota bacterium]
MITFTHERHINASPEAVFAAVEDPVRLATWWGPDGFTNTFSVFDFRVGGRWEFVMHGPQGAEYPNQCEFMEVVPGRRVVVRHLSLPHFSLSIELHPAAQGTRVDWRQSFDDDKTAQAVKHIVEPANEQNLTRLAHEVERVVGRGA